MGVAVHKFDSVNSDDAVRAIVRYAPDLIAVVAYGQILGRKVLEIPRLGCVNLHGSMLPKYRGAAPCQWAIANGESVTGVSIIRMNERMDAGDILLARPLDILPDDTGGTLLERVAEVGAGALCDTVVNLAAGRLTGIPQNDADATFARKLSKGDGQVDWTRPARDVHNRIRAFQPWPGAWCRIPIPSGAYTVKILGSCIVGEGGPAGCVLACGDEGIVVGCGEGGVLLTKVQPEGRTAMGAGEFARGHRLSVGATLGGL
jgi:methionyl-tRNA formyltransferase